MGAPTTPGPEAPRAEGKLVRALERHARVLKRTIPAALAGDAGAVHDARVATRRVREAVPLLVVATAASDALGRKARQVTRALGPVRELDVEIALLDEFRARAGEAGAAIEDLRASLERRRAKKRGRMLERLESLDASRFARRVRRAAASLSAAALPSLQAAVSSRLARRAAALRQAVEAAGTVYEPERLHVVRLAVKKLRYTVELSQLLGVRATAAPLARLKNAQRLLGRLHDVVVLAADVERRSALASPAAGPLASLTEALEREARVLHGRYLRLRRGLFDLASRSSRPPNL